MFAAGYLTYRKDLKMDEELSFFEKYFPERYETLKRGLTDGVPVPGLPGGFKVYEKEAMIGIVLESLDTYTGAPHYSVTSGSGLIHIRVSHFGMKN